jgi:hypothetical protein
VDNPWSHPYFSLVTTMMDVFKNVMTPGLDFFNSYPCFLWTCSSHPRLFHFGDLACLANVKEQFCHSIFKECAEVDGYFFPALSWSVHALNTERTICTIHCFWLFFCSRSECERRKRIWDACVAEINEDLPDKEDFDAQMLALTSTIGLGLRKLIDTRDYFFQRLYPSLHISVALGADLYFRTDLPSGPSGERSPFRFLECSVQGGDRDQIEDADAAIAWVLGQLPAVRMSWPQHMEVQDLYPVATSNYTWPTGTKVKVPCFAQGKVVAIPIAECPDSFVNPMNPNNDRACVKVLRGVNCDICSFFLTFLPQIVHAQPCPVAAYSDKEYTWMWAISNAVGVGGLLLNVFMCTTWSDHIYIVLVTDWHVPLVVLLTFSHIWLHDCRWLGGKRMFAAVPYQVKACVFAGLLYGIVGTLPSLILKHDLPCSECKTEEW